MKTWELKKLIKEIVQEAIQGMEAFTPDQIDTLKNMGFMKMKFPVPQILDGQQPSEQLHLDSLEVFGFRWDEQDHAFHRQYITDDIKFIEMIFFSPSRPLPVVFVRTVSNSNNNEGTQTRFSEFPSYEKLETILDRLSVYDSDVIHAEAPPQPTPNPVAPVPPVPPAA